jgi:tripartite-type tricarboxylate transporter receptor subunit TctC
VATLNSALVEALQTPEVKARLTVIGLDPVTSSPEEFAALIRSDVPKWAQVVKASGARAD